MRLKLDIPNRLECHNLEIKNRILKTVISKSKLALPIQWSVSKILGFREPLYKIKQPLQLMVSLGQSFDV